MILDKDTNKIFLSDLLWQRFYNVAEAMDYHCRENHIQMEIAYATKDIWMRDFMPVQTERDKFIGYLYDPDYLKDLKYQDSRTDGNKLAKNLGFTLHDCKLILDGGNIIKTPNHIIMTDKVFKENKIFNEKEIIKQLESFFEVEILFLPWDKAEIFGHTDGIVRYMDNNSLLMTNYHDYSPKYADKFYSILSKYYDIKILEYKVEKPDKKNWCYINFLRVGNTIFLPQLTPIPFIHPLSQISPPSVKCEKINIIEEDRLAISQFEKYFPECNIIPINCPDIVNEGGALNCISWNIKI